MATFKYVDRDGHNDYNAQGRIAVDIAKGTINVGMTVDDGDGETYIINVQRHRAALLQVAHDIIAALDANEGKPAGFDGFYTAYATAYPSRSVDDESWFGTPGTVEDH